MDYQTMADSIALPCAILSVEKTAEGLCGEIRVVCSNARFKEIAGPACHDGALYQELVPKNLKFEDFCFRSAILGERRHVYVEHKAVGGWIDQQAIPMLPVNDNLGCCQFTFELTPKAEYRRMASVSMDTAEAAIKASITLMGAEDFREGVRTVLNDTMIMSGAHNSRLFLLDHKNRMISVFCETVGPQGIRRHNDGLNYDLIETWEKHIDGSAMLVTKPGDIEALEKENPAWVANLKEYGVHSLALLPLRREKETFGFVDFVNFDVSKTAQVKELAELIAIYLGAEISSHLLMERLEEMSTTDPLTGLRNRVAMLRKMEMINGGEYGVINLDLNGLKTMNDTQGHEAGDRLLVAAAEALKKVYYYNDIYRTGGDEFIVLIPGIGRESFERKLRRFRAVTAKDGELSFAIGAFWSDGSEDIATAFRNADMDMYRDKEEFYRQNPSLRRG